MEISDEHIKRAEELLLGDKTFDEKERIPFIKNLTTLDLLAVPGSGKTTALQAKLYCIAQQMPFEDGSGILVLSHTNAAVEEIEKNLKSICPQLFTYPNFVGTIQSFVNKFLANQACYSCFGSYIRINDNDIYYSQVKKFYNKLEWKKHSDKENKLKNLLYGKANHGRSGLTTEQKNQNTIDFIYNLKFDLCSQKILYGSKLATLYSASGKARDKYEELFTWKKSLFEQGILSFSDSYYLANWYLVNYPKVIEYLQSRFTYIFVDEAQDLEKYQLDIIDEIFYKNGRAIIQRVGDINQAIYNSSKAVKTQCDWKTRNEYYLKCSHRLTKEIADVVNNFTLDCQQDQLGNPKFEVDGLRILESNIKPHLILFDDSSKSQIQNKFDDLIKSFKLEKTVEGQKYGFHIIGWNGNWKEEKKDESKLRLEDIFPNYKKDTKSSKSYYNTLSEYIQYFNKDAKTLENAKNAILELLQQVLYLEGKTNTRSIKGVKKEMRYTQVELLKLLKEDDAIYEDFKLKLYSWSFSMMVKQDYEKVYQEIKAFILGEFKTWFSLQINNETKLLLEENFKPALVTPSEETKRKDRFSIEINTVHSVKGKTHCATMYVETSYHNYETEKLKSPNPLYKEKHNYIDPKVKNITRAIETIKMMYVGFSRPTHLLCFAVLKDNVKNDLKKYQNAGWEIVDLTETISLQKYLKFDIPEPSEVTQGTV